MTIESRKIVFLDLDPRLNSTERTNDVGEDEYIVEIPTNQPRTILSINLSNSIQSLHTEIDDLSLKDLDVQYEFDVAEKTVQLTLTDNKHEPQQKIVYSLQTDLNLKIERNDEDVRLVLIGSPTNKIQNDYLFVKFILKLSNDEFSYFATVKLFLAKKDNILFSGFDFGSEASQMCEGRYNPHELATIDSKPIALFTAVRDRLDGNHAGNDSDYIQHESELLYKSIFYLKRQMSAINFTRNNELSVQQNDLNILTLTKNRTPSFFNEWMQIPNLKLIHDSPAVVNSFKFSINTGGNEFKSDLSEHRKDIYSALLKELLLSYFEKAIHADVYLRFTLLVPNIYTIGQINETKQLLRKIILEPSNGFSRHVKGLEISSLSESDAAFLGYLTEKKVKAGKYYIIIDCGKGTTDFSILQSEDKSAATFKPIYRHGFAGAGNLITFAFMQSALYYLANSSNDPNSSSHFQNFINRNFIKGPENDIKKDFFERTELWKKNYDPQLTQSVIEEEWSTARSGNISLENLFSVNRDDRDFISFLNKLEHAQDWGGFVQAAVADIVKKIRLSFAPVITHLNKKSKCDGILFTGRGFLFRPLEQAARVALQSIKGMNSVEFLEIADKDLKGICLKGVFARNIISYNDIVSTPIEIKKGELKQFTKADIKQTGIFGPIRHFANRLLSGDVVLYNESTNSCPVTNLDLSNCQFLIGGKIYQPDWRESVSLESANLVRSRKGFFIRAKDSNEKIHIVDLYKADLQIKGFQQDTLIKSLFPGWYDPEILNNN